MTNTALSLASLCFCLPVYVKLYKDHRVDLNLKPLLYASFHTIS